MAEDTTRCCEKCTAFWHDRTDPLAMKHGYEKWQKAQHEIHALAFLAACEKMAGNPQLLAKKLEMFEAYCGGADQAKLLLDAARTNIILWTSPVD